MRVEIRPEPSPEEREALIQALAAADGASEETSRWWEAGVREATDDDPDGVAPATLP